MLKPGRSLQRELPLGIGALLVVTVSALAIVMYREVRRSAIDAASERLERTTLQLSQLLSQSTRTRYATIDSTTALPAVRAFMRHGGSPPRAQLQKLLVNPQIMTAIELWDPTGRRLTTVGGAPAALDSAHAHETIGALREGSNALGRFERTGDSITYTLISKVTEGTTTLGYLVERRRLATSPQGSRALADLIGEGATLAIGNANGDVWTDFNKPIKGPPAEVLTPGLHEYAGDSLTVYARSARIAATPWQVVVEFPRHLVLARANAFLVRLAWITLGILIVGVSVAWLVTRQIIKPLRKVTDAAEAMAGGRAVGDLVEDRSDEIGRLTKSFNSMASEVAHSRARLEGQVAERTAELQETMQELEAFSYTVSHDLRAPLRAMQGFAQALLEDYSPSLDEAGRDYATRVVDASRRMDDLIQDLLAYSRLGREQLSLASVDIDPIATDAVQEVESDVRARGGRVEIATPLGEVTGNARILKQILSNLVGNAVKFIPPGTPPAVRISAEARNGRRRIWVEDNGIGIASEHRERIFRVFERLHGGETYPGTGIGLAIVRRGAERMDGTAGVESTPGQGSRFWVELPAEGLT